LIRRCLCQSNGEIEQVASLSPLVKSAQLGA
jgi:hypothetical protein